MGVGVSTSPSFWAGMFSDGMFSDGMFWDGMFWDGMVDAGKTGHPLKEILYGIR
jgi:hypothetical protein